MTILPTDRRDTPSHAGLHNDAITLSGAVLPVYNVKSYGAIGDGLFHAVTAADITSHPTWRGSYVAGVSTWDDVGIQEALYAAMYSITKAGDVYLPPAPGYWITQTIKYFRLDNAQHYVNLLGGGMTGTALQWYGPTSGQCLRTLQNKNTTISGFRIENKVVVGTTIGFVLTNVTGQSLGTNGQTITNVSILNFNYGWSFGEPGNPSAGEIVCINCQAHSCTRGMYLTSSNTLDLQFVEVELSLNTIGMYADVGASINIFGGGCSNNGTDFELLSGGNYSIHGVRSEAVGTGNVNGRFALIGSTSAYSGVLIDSCQVGPADAGLDGIVIEIGSGACVTVMNCGLRGGGISASTNFTSKSNTLVLIGNEINDTVPFRNLGGTRDLLRYISFGNVNFAQIPFDNEWGVMVGGVRTPLMHQFGVGATAKQSLSQTVGISATSTEARNVRGTATLAAGTATVAFGTAEVQSLVATSASAGTFTLTFDGATTSALNWNATAGQVQTALRALLPIGSTNVVCSGGALPNVAVVITFAAALGGGARNLITATSSLTGGTAVVTRTAAGTGNPPEPDASYTVSVAASAPEAIGVSAKGTTGFTLTSSNVGSTATVDWHLIR